jgi:diguanylate cyclase (GGDEF)-like protein
VLISLFRKFFQPVHSFFSNAFIRWIALNLTIAIAYAVAARLSLDFATLPNKVSAVWLPSGLTTAWISWFGRRNVIPGIFIGSLVALCPDLLTIGAKLKTSSLLTLAVILALGDCLQPIVIVAVVKKITGLPIDFSRVQRVAAFILSSIIGPAVSATNGVTALYVIVQPLHQDDYGISWLTWWLASALANLLFTPLLLLWKQRSQFKVPSYWMEQTLLIGLILGLSWLTFIENYPVEYMFLPLLIWSAFRLGSFFTSAMIAMIAIITILMTAKGFGPFTTRSPNESLLLSQSFIAVCSVTNIVLTAAIHERRVAELALEQTLASLEQQVEQRTSELQESKSIVDSFFASAPLGLGIVNDALQYVQVNYLLAHFNGRPIGDHVGQSIQKISPDRASSLAPVYQQVLLTGQPILNQEETRTTLEHPMEARTWLMSYFPIATHSLISKVGVIVMEISDRKKLEQQLKRQARQDPLTSLSNRLHFKEVSEFEWKRCKRGMQPFSIILIDIDYFKRYNDTYGHLTGDTCLIQVAQLLMTIGGRAGDLVVRFGGEEFLIMLPETDAIGALHVAESVHQRLRDCQIPHKSSSAGDYVTLSMGVVTCIPNLQLQMDDVIQKADEALYESKRQGRDRTTAVTIALN